MKKVIAGLTLQLAGGFAGALNHQSELTISGTDRSMVSVSIDNLPFGNYGTTVDFNSVEPGYHYLIVYKSEPLKVGHGYHHKKFTEKIVYNGYIQIPAASLVSGTTDNNDRLAIAIQPLHADHFYNNTHYNSVYTQVPACMSPVDFAELKNVIANRPFDSSKLQVAKQAIAANLVSSAQLAELMNMLSFESGKLELAEAGYTNVIDKQNFFVVNNAFTFESSIDELQRFIRDNS
jgi:hypothetical protein